MTELTLNRDKIIVMSLGEQGNDIDIRHLCTAHNIPFERQICLSPIKRGQLKTRSQLILLGGPVETHLTQIALDAMIENFQVFVLVDRLISDIPSHKESVLERLYQNGVSPLLWVQMRHEVNMQG